MPAQDFSLQDIAMKRHRFNVLHAKAVVDHLPLPLNLQRYFQTSNLNAAAARFRQINYQNMKLVQMINVIDRTTGKVDCHLRMGTKARSNLQIRMMEADTISAHNRQLYKRILKAEATMKTADLERDWERIEKVLEASSKYPLCWKKSRKDDEIDKKLQQEIRCSGFNVYEMRMMYKLMRPRVFFTFTGPGELHLGQIDIELYRDVVPRTVENFLSLCIGTNDEKNLCYRNTPIFRINTELYCLGGDVTNGNGTGGRSIYGEEFPAENFELQHSRRGMLSMVTHKEMCNSTFMITFRALHTLDKKNVVFGRIIKGMQTLQSIEGFGTRNGKPVKEAIIAECGQTDY